LHFSCYRVHELFSCLEGGLEIWGFSYGLAFVVGIGLVDLGHGNFDMSFAVKKLKRVLLSKGLLVLFISKK
jgi:hypothetical protein